MYERRDQVVSHFLVVKLLLIFLWITTVKTRKCWDKTIGLESTVLFPDKRFSASSYYSSYYKPSKARPSNNGDGWMPKGTNNLDDYLQIDLGIEYLICAVATKGSGSYYVEAYKILFSLNNKNWTTYQENGQEKVFNGNTNGINLEKRYIRKTLMRYIRFIIVDHRNEWKELKVGIYGYTISEGCITNPLGMESRAIPDNHLSASSSSQSASNARLQSASSWCASSSDSSPYLQIDLGSGHVVCAVATQGNSAADQWVTTYRISTFSNGSSWRFYTESNTTRIFYGNYDGSTTVHQVLYNSPTLRYIRFHPETFKTTPCLRIEIYGYKLQPACLSNSVGIPSSNLVPDYRFSAFLPGLENSYYAAFRGRLGGSRSWRAKSDSDYLQIDLGNVFYVCAVLTQGNYYYNHWVKKYKIAFSVDNKSWTVYRDPSGREKEFNGNTDRGTIVRNNLLYPLRAKFVHVQPTAYYRYRNMRVDFKGSVAACTSPLGLEDDKEIPDSHMTSSSSSDSTHGPSRGRLYGGSSWCSTSTSNTEYIQVDLGQIKTVTGIATQGDPRRYNWVTLYIVTYSSIMGDWYEYKEGQATKVFSGNQNRKDVIVNWLSRPVAARYVRILPKTSYGENCLRFDLYGCDFAVSPTASLDINEVVLPSSKGSSKTLTCTANGEPSPSIHWFVNGAKISGETQKTLKVRFVSAEDIVSQYSCVKPDPNTRPVVCKTNFTCSVMYPIDVPSAAVSVAMATVTVNLNVPSALKASGTRKQRSIHLTWSTPIHSDDTGKITSYIIELKNITKYTFHHILPPATSYDLTYLKPYTSYAIRTRVVSTVGDGLWSQRVKVKTMMAKPEGTPSITRIEPESSESMRITWRFSSLSKLNGPLAGYSIFYVDEQGNKQEKRVGDLITTVLKSLRKYMQYRITISVRNTQFVGPESTAVSGKTLQDAPTCSPRLISANALTSTSIKVTWDQLPNSYCRNGILKGYKVLYRKKGGSKDSVDTKNVDLSKVIEGLEKYTSYTFEVLGYTIKDGPLSNAVVETTLQDAPTAPINQVAKLQRPQGDFHSPRIEIKWEEPSEKNGIIQQYTLIYYYNDDISTQKEVNITNINSLTFTLNVLGEATFWYKIAATTIKKGPYTQKKDLYIRAYPPSVAPRRVRNSKINETAFIITWQPLLRNESNGIIRKYKVNWILKHIGRTTRMVAGEKFTGTTQGTQFMINNLRLCAQYEILVAGMTSAGAGPNATISITTSQPGEPINLKSIEAGKTFVILRWEKPKGVTQEIKSYTIEIAGSKPTYWPEYKSVPRKENQDGSQSELKVLNLVPGTKYEFLVIASTVCGESNKSLPAIANTDVDKPVRPEGKPVSLKDSFNVTLWTVEPTNGPISSYQVLVVIGNKKNKTNIPEILYGYTQAKEKDQNVYITAEVTSDQIKSRTLFRIGDGKMYGEYKNVPLEKGKTYEIAQRAITKYKGKVYTGEAAQVATIEMSPEQAAKGKSKKSGSVGEAVIGGVVGVLLIILILLVIGAFLYKRQRKRKAEEISLPLNDVADNGGEACNSRAVNNSLMQDEDLAAQSSSDKRLYENVAKLKKTEESADNDTKVLLKEDAVIYDEANDSNTSTKPMPVRQFLERMKTLQATKYAQLEDEFKNLLNTHINPVQTAKKPANKKKNRYGNIVTYDHSRVVMKRSGDEHSDYVNASFINGFDQSTVSYIATQGPLPLTFADFWQMIWEQNTHTIVMLTNLQEGNKTKCHQYWPEGKETYRDITVAVHKTEVFPDYIIRTFLLTESNGNETRSVKHFQFIVWPDKGVPHFATAVLALRRKVKASNPSAAGPVVVHCSAGVGRTGAYIVIDAMLDRVKALKNVDISNYVASIRKARPYMVQTSEQYIFIHLAIYEVLTCGNTEIQACNIRIAMTKLAGVNQKNATGYAVEYERLNKVTADYSQEECDVGKKKENVSKNRYKDIVALNRSRVFLSKHGEEIGSDYINASHIDAYKERNAFFVTQAPMQNTIEDFWIMVANYEVVTVVMLNALEEESEHFQQYWPANGCASYGQVSVELQDTKTLGEVISRRLLVTYDRAKLHVNHLQVLHWADHGAPTNPQSILDLLKEVEQSQRLAKNAPVVVQCSNGVGRSGTFCAIVSIVERAKEEQVIDVFQAVKRIRANRPGAVDTLTQYIYCYEMAQKYLDSFSDYANFAECS